MTDKPLCPGCDRPMVWLSSPQVWKCFKCEKPPEVVPMPLWMKVFILAAVIIVGILLLLMVIYAPTGGGGLANLTLEEGLDTMGGVVDDPMVAFTVILIFGMGVAYAMERGKQRCPTCGEVLKRTPTGHYYCMHCRSMYDPEDIEVEVVE